MSFEDLETFIDSRQIPTDERLDSDVCIVGAGAAGIAVAREFINSDAKILLLESGGLDFDEEIEAMNVLSVTGHRYAREGSRLRFFGGTSNHWGGHCVPMRPSVFERRDWIPYSGWPFGIDEMNPYYGRAHEVLEIGPYDYRATPIAERLSLELLPFDSAKIETAVSRYHRQNFGHRYRQDLDEAKNISVLLFATVTGLDLDEHKRFVEGATVKTLAGNEFTVRAKLFVLAAGGIENPRILLLSNHDVHAGLGNQYDLVGRFFMEHIWYDSGMILPAEQDPEPVKLYADEIPFEGDYGVRCHLVLPEARARELRIPEYRVELQIERTRRFHPSVRSAARFKRSVEQLNFENLSASDILDVLSDPYPAIAHVMDGDAPLVYGFGNHVEQIPNPESRVSLNDKTDALGQSMIELNWQLSDLDKEGIIKAQLLIAQEVGRSGIGRMYINMPELEETILDGAYGGNHHMGTTRMHNDPKQGVVDANCRIHGIENLFVAGSSVFPTAGYPNPTLTITALALRLADHLRLKLARL
jgi:choline dehydrogenase-like flavoprotein